MKTNIVVVRVDASPEIGIGHFMRTFEFARQLKAKGSKVHFICRQLLPWLKNLVAQEGFHLWLFSSNSMAMCHSGVIDENQLLAADNNWQADVVNTVLQLEQIGNVDLLVVDSYTIDARWEHVLKRHVGSLLVIDDLANRKHDAHYLVDHNCGRTKADYEKLVAKDCVVLAGPQYAMLRQRFAELRPQTLMRRKTIPNKKQLLITLGGGEVGDQNSQILNLICQSDVSSIDKITLSNPGGLQPQLAVSVAKLSVEVEVLSYIEDMAHVMSKSDLCIGAGGISSMERAVLGIPSLVLLMADNQVASSENLARIGCLFACIKADDLNVDLLNRFFSMSCEQYKLISDSASDVSDGRGIQRILGELGYG